MAITFDRTPLAAVAGLAERGGEARTARRTQQFERTRGLQDTQIAASRARLTDQIRSSQIQQQESIAANEQTQRRRLAASQQSQEAVFRQQLAQTENQARFNREAQERAFGLQNAANERNLVANQQQQQEALGLLEELKPSLDPQVYVESILAIKQNKVPKLFRTETAKEPQRSATETIELVGRVAALPITQDQKRALHDQLNLPSPVAENNRVMTQSGREAAEIDVVNKLPDPFFGGASRPGPDFGEKLLLPIYKNFLEDNRYLLLGTEGRRELEDIWERAINRANAGSVFAFTGGGRFNLKNQYAWNKDSTKARAVRQSFGGSSLTEKVTPTDDGISDTQIVTELVNARKSLGPDASPEAIQRMVMLNLGLVN